MLKQEVLRFPVRKPNFISAPAILKLFGLVLPFFVCFCNRVLKVTQGGKRLGDICTHTFK